MLQNKYLILAKPQAEKEGEKNEEGGLLHSSWLSGSFYLTILRKLVVMKSGVWRLEEGVVGDCSYSSCMYMHWHPTHKR